MKSFSIALRRQKTSPPASVAAKETPAARTPRKSRWRRWVLDPVVVQLSQGITPEKISLSLAVGSLCAFFPILGAATPLCILAGIALRLNQSVIQIVNGLTLPLYPLAAFGCIRLGSVLLGATPAGLDPRVLGALLQNDPAQFLHRFGPIAGQAVLGWMVLAPIWVAIWYFGLLPVLRLGTPAPRLSAA